MRPEHWIYTIPLRLRSLFRWAQADQELDDELRDHLERRTGEDLAHGNARGGHTGVRPRLGRPIRISPVGNSRLFRKLFDGRYRLYKQDHSRGRRLTTTGQPTVSLLPLKPLETLKPTRFIQNLANL